MTRLLIAVLMLIPSAASAQLFSSQDASAIVSPHFFQSSGESDAFLWLRNPTTDPAIARVDFFDPDGVWAGATHYDIEPQGVQSVLFRLMFESDIYEICPGSGGLIGLTADLLSYLAPDGDGHRGFATVTQVEECDFSVPSSAPYSGANSLTGYFFDVELAGNFADSGSLLGSPSDEDEQTHAVPFMLGEAFDSTELTVFLPDGGTVEVVGYDEDGARVLFGSDAPPEDFGDIIGGSGEDRLFLSVGPSSTFDVGADFGPDAEFGYLGVHCDAPCYVFSRVRAEGRYSIKLEGQPFS